MQKNRIELAGHLAAKPELRYLPSGTKVANARLGESYRYERKNGQSETHTNWHSLTFYDQLAELALTFDKGDNIAVEGRIEQRQFTPADGSKRTIHEVIVKSCHRIAPLRQASASAEHAPPEPIEAPKPVEGEAAHDPTWPV